MLLKNRLPHSSSRASNSSSVYMRGPSTSPTSLQQTGLTHRPSQQQQARPKVGSNFKKCGSKKAQLYIIHSGGLNLDFICIIASQCVLATRFCCKQIIVEPCSIKLVASARTLAIAKDSQRVIRGHVQRLSYFFVKERGSESPSVATCSQAFSQC